MNLWPKLRGLVVLVISMRNKQARIPNIGSIHTYAGSPIHEILEPRFDGNGTRLVVAGEENIQERMEAEAPMTDINYMLHRLSLGDQSVLSSRRPMYGDFTGLPSDPIEALNLVHESEASFGQLPTEEKLKYNNDWRKWFADILSNRTVSRETISDVKQQTSVEKKEVRFDVSEDSGSAG